MKIVSMHVYGFGQLENTVIDHLADFQVFYGENEAGKSTIMAFIHAILFGFPTKQQAELRYEPKHSSRYGGNIKIITEDRGFVVIERVKGKTAAGDVAVTFENGVTGGEELVKELLSNIDKGLFQAIFSFNLHGLQNIHQMKGEEIGRFLFSAGTLGTDRLALADSELQKELDARFKPSGKKPLINEKLQELHKLNKELKEAAAKNQEYETFIQQQNRLANEMAETQATIMDVHKKMESLKEWKKIEGLVKEEKWTGNELNKLGDVSFPSRGIERLEGLKPLLSSNKAQMISITERIENLKQEIENLNPNQTMLENESEILAALEQYPLYQQLKLQESQAEIKLHQLEENLADFREKLHLPLDADDVRTINTNIYMKDKVEKLSRQGQMMNERKQQLDRSFNEEKAALESVEDQIRSVQSRMIPPLERSELEKSVNEGLNSDKMEMKLQAVRDKIEFYKNAANREKDAAVHLQKQKQLQLILFVVLFFGLGVYGWITGQTALTFIGGIGFILAMLLLASQFRKPLKKSNDDTLTKLLQEEQELLHSYNKTDFKRMAALQEKLAQDQRLSSELQLLQVKHDQQLGQYDKVIKRFEEWELEATQYKKQIKDVSMQLKIPEYMANSYLAESFQCIEQIKFVTREQQQLSHRMNTLKIEQEEMIQKVRDLGGQYLQDKNTDASELVYLLRDKLKEEREKSVQWKEKQEKLADFNMDLAQLNQEKCQITADLSALLHEANAENENEFYDLGAMAGKKTKLLERLEDFEKQLHHSFLSKSERESLLQVHNIDEMLNEYSQKSENLSNRLTKLQEQQASIKYKIQMLEEGGMYSELLHRYKQKKYELEEFAKEWAVYCLAQNILFQTIEKYKNVHLPRMLSKAEEYLSHLTDGRYKRILLQQSGPGFLIERKDGTIFEANELSQATTEQVYVSIRLALATTLYENYHLPIIIDDSFVNFDAKRAQKVISLLQQLKQNQVLFFTCHQHLLPHFNKYEILHLNNVAPRHSIS